MAHSKDNNTYYKVTEYAEHIGKSKQSVYGRIKRGTLKTETIDNIQYVVVNKDDLTFKDNMLTNDEQTLSKNSQGKDNELKSIENDMLKKEIKKYKKILKKRELKIEELYNNIINMEQSQKKEIIHLQNQKHNELKMYMEFVSKKANNILESDPSPIKDDSIQDAEIVPTKKKKKKKKK